ncbi:hydroxyisourate hydrolase [Paenibacillus sambharensis]|uniref:5-hydroxyisourate hydrolase n=1 Tax=Paenibacillus sambharensis TaxID=1803190 RepID=A0A2W1L7D5_9BACL|nr:hydroxyisourate hydrolase [Paenibacillus sambharensis]PZD96098.1 hydroxyisourate hydrolase [Paenibacillus sambharensis]
MGGRVTTHVLDLSSGGPASGMKVELYMLAGGSGLSIRLAEGVTSRDGRLDEPLLAGQDMRSGIYELQFHVGAYYDSRQSCESDAKTAFLDQVPVRFRIEAAEEHYHIPLLVAPGGYSTYRGS